MNLCVDFGVATLIVARDHAIQFCRRLSENELLDNLRRTFLIPFAQKQRAWRIVPIPIFQESPGTYRQSSPSIIRWHRGLSAFAFHEPYTLTTMKKVIKTEMKRLKLSRSVNDVSDAAKPILRTILNNDYTQCIVIQCCNIAMFDTEIEHSHYMFVGPTFAYQGFKTRL